jgi:hypothetical protein
MISDSRISVKAKYKSRTGILKNTCFGILFIRLRRIKPIPASIKTIRREKRILCSWRRVDSKGE